MKQRGYKAGVAEGKSIVEIVNLFYQNNTALHFYKGLLEILEEEYKRRKEEKKNGR